MNIRVITLLLAFFIFLPLAHAEDKDRSKYYFIGSIGYDLPIQMELSVEGVNVRGTYYYEKSGIPLTITGDISPKESKIKLVESDDKNIKTGVFEGTFIPIPDGIGGSIEGAWSSPDGKNKLPFRLTKVANYEFFKIKQGNFSEATWSYPKLLSDNEVIQKISSKLYDSMKPPIEEYQKDAKEGFMEDLITSTWLFNYDYSIEYYSDSLISFTGLVYSYTGGAHGNTYFVASNYAIDAKDSKLLKLSDLFKKDSNYVKVLSDRIIEDLKKQKAGWVINGEITSLKEEEIGPFALTPEGIRFAFAPYAVGSYAEGAYFVAISYESLQSIIDPTGPLAKFMKTPETKIEQ